MNFSTPKDRNEKAILHKMDWTCAKVKQCIIFRYQKFIIMKQLENSGRNQLSYLSFMPRCSKIPSYMVFTNNSKDYSSTQSKLTV